MNKKQAFKKYDILEITWLDSHAGSGWKNPSEVEDWIKRSETEFLITTLGYFFHEDANFIRVAQSKDFQSLSKGSDGDNLDGLFAVPKSFIKGVRKLS